MAFTPIRTILDEKGTRDPLMREAEALGALRHAWKTKGVFLFAKPARQHLRQSVRIDAFRGATVFFGASDAQTASLLHVRQTEILALLRSVLPSLEVSALVIANRSFPAG